jgi:hypothetical protein
VHRPSLVTVLLFLLIGSHAGATNLVLDNAITTLTGSDYLNSTRLLDFLGGNSPSNWVTLNGAGNTLIFPYSSSVTLTVAANKKAVLENIILDGLNPSHIGLGTGASLTFGDSVIVRLTDNVDLAFTWSFTGNSTFEGCGKKLHLTNAGALFIDNPSKSLTLRDLTLDGLGTFTTVGVAGANGYTTLTTFTALVTSAGPNPGEWNYNGRALVSSMGNNVVDFYTYDPGSGGFWRYPSLTLSGYSDNMSWHPTSNYVFIGVGRPQIYLFNATAGTLTQKGTIPESFNAQYGSWHPTGNYLAVRDSSTGVRVYQFNSGTEDFSILAWAQATVAGAARRPLAWHGSGQYLILGAQSGSDNLIIYKFLTGSSSFTNVINGVRTSPTTLIRVNPVYADYFAVVASDGGTARNTDIYRLNTSNDTVTLLDSFSSNCKQEPSGFWSGDGLKFFYPSSTGTVLKARGFTPNSPGSEVFTDIAEYDKSVAAANNGIGALAYDKNLNTLVIAYQNPAGSEAYTITSLSLITLTNNNLACLNDNAKIVLENADLYFSSTYTFSFGAIDILGDVRATSTWAKFVYTSGKSLTIKPNSSLLLDRGLTFSYQSLGQTKDAFVMADASSTLFLRGMTLYSTLTGVKLNTGKLLIGDKVTLKSDANNQGEALVLGSNLRTTLLPGAIVDVQGIVVYE